ncbi:MAG: cysteine hydrolase [Caldilineaceae bacterium]|nr:cysteine hydrolase [Caldilineaceae bacterium]
MWKLTDDAATTALLLIDVINDLEFDGGDDLLVHAQPMAHQIAALKQAAKRLEIPVIYANDNFGQWRSDFRRLVQYCCESDVRGQAIARMLRPHDDDYFILKPKHSAFFQTNLDLLLKDLGIKRLIMTGMAADICVIFTANDAYMRDFQVVVPADCVASESADDNEKVLGLMARVLKADITPFAAGQAAETGR